ncbi:Sorting nexin-3 [Nosema granulosis]|uniref:Sorting nexin-3 n=1 Tax=Nosema granulosis TaxID=83296 RepID=A0A9P6KYB6_9MICR|nr:Sorting nexin-3 [Nosema granulosis]
MNILLETSISKTFCKNNKYTLYEIVCITNLPTKKNCFFKVHKRYSDFYVLHGKIKMHLKNLPPFPKKKYFKMDYSTITERMIMFDGYLRYLCHMVISNNITDECKALITSFLNIDSISLDK